MGEAENGGVGRALLYRVPVSFHTIFHLVPLPCFNEFPLPPFVLFLPTMTIKSRL
jgi:hypothetical protein